VIYNPLCGGLLTGKYKSDSTTEEGRYSTTTNLGPIYRALYFKESNFQAVEIIRSTAEKHNLSMIEVALRWCVYHSALRTDGKGNNGVIIGVNKIEQLEDNIRDLKKGPLPTDVVNTLDKAWIIAKPASTNPWHSPLAYSYNIYQLVSFYRHF
jgi:aflatoxin B1 aldehyde reductase